MRYDYDFIRDNNPHMSVNDIITVNGIEYIITEVKCEYSENALPIVEYKAQCFRNDETYLINDLNDHYYSFTPYNNSITIRSLLDVTSALYSSTPTEDNLIEEVSEDTRKEFIKLLE